MSDPQRVQLFKSKRDAAIDIAALAMFTGMIYLVMNPNACEKASDALDRFANKMAYRVSVWQTKVAIRNLPETDDR